MHPRLQWALSRQSRTAGFSVIQYLTCTNGKYIKEVRSPSQCCSNCMCACLFTALSIRKKIEQSGLKSFQHHNDAHPRRLRKFSESIRTASVSLCWKTAAWWHGGTTVKATSPSIKSYQYAIANILYISASIHGIQAFYTIKALRKGILKRLPPSKHSQLLLHFKSDKLTYLLHLSNTEIPMQISSIHTEKWVGFLPQEIA